MKKLMAAALLLAAFLAEAAPLRIGWAMNDISTDKPV